MNRSTAILLTLAACDPGTDAPVISADTEGVVVTPIEGACPEGTKDDPWADCIEAFEPGPEAVFGHDMLPEIVLGAPMPPAAGGSLDVVSLGCGGQITLAFDAPGIVDGPGDDLVVYENPFATGDTSFAEPARVLVSDDGEVWRAFGCTLTGAEDWPPQGCAGITPVSTGDDGVSGGDAFDLADVGLARARFVRLVDVSIAYYGSDVWCTGPSGGFDLDAVEAIPR